MYCMDVTPVNLKAYVLWLRQEMEGGMSGRRKCSGIEPGAGGPRVKCDEMDTWYLSPGNQPRGRM